MPTCFSPYLEAAFSLCERFKIDAIRIGWNEKERLAVLKQLVERSASIFCDLAEQARAICLDAKKTDVLNFSGPRLCGTDRLKSSTI